MTSPNTSSTTSSFGPSGNLTIDPLLTEVFQKWGGGIGTGANLSFSFPWANDNDAYWQTDYSYYHEPDATFHYSFNAIQMQAARNVLQAWGNVANLNFTEVAETSTNVGDIRFGFSSAVDATGAWGWCYYPNNYWASGADVWIDTSYSSDPDWSPGSYNYEALTHEIGHGLGLKHPGSYSVGGDGTPGPYLTPTLDNRYYTIMSYNDPVKSYYWDGMSSSKVNPETPMVGDIQAIQYLYGANNSYHTGGDIYTFNPNDPFYKTIWDAGGIDTIDVSNFSLGCSIDLTPGSYSKVSYAPPTWSTEPYWYDGSNALGIAFGAIIENAVGGTGNDTLTGNVADNVLNGGIGNDTLNGLGGNDTLIGGGGEDHLLGGLGADQLDGSLGYTYADYAEAVSGVSAYLTWEAGGAGEAAGDTFIAIEGLVGSNFADILSGNTADNNIQAGGGNDWLFGREGNDFLVGGVGNDVLSGGTGNDQMDGGEGTDVAYYRDAQASIFTVAGYGSKQGMVDGHSYGISLDLTTVLNNFGEATNDQLTNVENLWGSHYDDIIRGDATSGQVFGFEGNDILDGRGGDDVFYGGTGTDTLTGGTGADDFFYLSHHDHYNQYGTLEAYEGGDTITDFQPGVDHLTVSRYWFGFGNIQGIAQSLTTEYTDFITLGAAISSKPTFFWNGATGALVYDADGTGATGAVNIVTLTGGVSLTLADIWTA